MRKNENFIAMYPQNNKDALPAKMATRALDKNIKTTNELHCTGPNWKSFHTICTIWYPGSGVVLDCIDS